MYTFKTSGYGVESARIDGSVLNALSQRYRKLVENSQFNDVSVAQCASPLYPPESQALYGSVARNGQKATSYVLLLLRPQSSEHLLDRMDIRNTDEVLVAYCSDHSFVRIKQRSDTNISLDSIGAVLGKELQFKEWTALFTERGREMSREAYQVADTGQIDSVDFRALDKAGVTLHSVTWGNGIQMEGQYGPLFRGMSSPASVSLAPVQTGAYKEGIEREDVALIITTQWRTGHNLEPESNNHHNQFLYEGRHLEIPSTFIVGTFESVEGRVRLFTPKTDLSKVVAADVTGTDSRTLGSSYALVDFYRQLVKSLHPVLGTHRVY